MSFPEALKLVLKLEGGKSEVPGDNGGRTAYGITQKTYDEWNSSRKAPTRDVWEIGMDEVEAIYLKRYWLSCGCNAMPEKLGAAVFQAAVLCGSARAVGWFYRVDWHEDATEIERVYAYLSLQLSYLLDLAKKPGQAKFATGWGNRVAWTYEALK